MNRLSIALLLAVFLVAPATHARDEPGARPPNHCIVPVEQDANWAVDFWRPRHEEKIAAARGSEIDLLMLGDSITQGWEGPGAAVWERYYGERKAFNLGFGGDRTEHVLWRLENGAVAGMQPKLVVLMIGTNNTGHRMDPADYTAEGIALIVTQLRERLPGARVLLLAIFPRHDSPYNDMRQRNEAINTAIAGLADDKSVFYLDVNAAFLDADGTLRADLMPDLLHPNEAGYAAWAEAMEPTLTQLLP